MFNLLRNWVFLFVFEELLRLFSVVAYVLMVLNEGFNFPLFVFFYIVLSSIVVFTCISLMANHG